MKDCKPKHFTEDELASWDYAQIWNKFRVPARPSKEELIYLENEIKNKKPDKMLILGSTIEYRSLAKKLGLFPYVADFSKSNYNVLTKYSKEKFDNEHFLEIDWLKIKEKNKYDIIIGHRVINVIGHSMLYRFFGRMYKVLKPNGIFYCKGNIKFKSGDKLEYLLKKWAFRKNRKYSLFSYIQVDLYFRCADKYGYVDYSKVSRLVNSWYFSKKISKKDYEILRVLVSMSLNARFRGKIYKKEVEYAIKNSGFKQVEWVILDEDICLNMPIIKLTK